MLDRLGGTNFVRSNFSSIFFLSLSSSFLVVRSESWRMCRIQQQQNNIPTQRHVTRGLGNPLSRELAIDTAYQLLHLDRTDMRVRLLIPSLLLEGGYYQEAYDYIKYWLSVDSSLMIMDLALMGREMFDDGGDDGEGSDRPFLHLHDQDMLEAPELWMDGEMVYPSVGMVFELAFLKCHLLTLVKSTKSDNETCRDGGTNQSTTLAERCATAAGEDELTRQVRLLLSVFHKWNSKLLPKLGESYSCVSGATITDAKDSKDVSPNATMPPSPPALGTLLNVHPPGFELQYRMGNPGGQSLDEAVSIWQRDMILWHIVDPKSMEYLSMFCANLEGNLVDTSGLIGGVVDGDGNANDGKNKGVKGNDGDEAKENIMKRQEAEELVAKLQRENPKRTMDQIMMHPEMAALMIKHLHTE
eukprot:scaffold9076_cov192-Alexandrium_tamarense.AAC.3